MVYLKLSLDEFATIRNALADEATATSRALRMMEEFHDGAQQYRMRTHLEQLRHTHALLAYQFDQQNAGYASYVHGERADPRE